MIARKIREVAMMIRDSISSKADFSYSDTWVAISKQFIDRAKMPEVRLRAHEKLNQGETLTKILDGFIDDIFGSES